MPTERFALDGFLYPFFQGFSEFSHPSFPSDNLDANLHYIHTEPKGLRYLPENLPGWQNVAKKLAVYLHDEKYAEQFREKITSLSVYDACVTLEILVDPVFGADVPNDSEPFDDMFQRIYISVQQNSADFDQFKAFVRSSRFFSIQQKMQCGLTIAKTSEIFSLETPTGERVV